MTDTFGLIARNGKRLLMSIVIILVTVTFVSYYSYRSATGFIDAVGRVNHTEQVLKTISAVEIALLNAETGERGYLIVGNADYLDPYYSALGSMDDDLRDLARLTVDNPSQQKHLQELSVQVKTRLDALKVSLDTYHAKGFAAVKGLTGQGKASMQNCRAILAAMADEENTLLEWRNAAAVDKARDAISTVFAALLISFCLIPLTFLLMSLGHVSDE